MDKEETKSEIKDEKELPKRKRAEYIGSIVVNAVLIFVLNNLLKWNVQILKESYNACLWAINVALGASIIINFVFIFYDTEWFKHFMEVFTSITSLIALYVIYTIFPFTFVDTIWGTVMRIFLIVAMVISGISIVYRIVRTVLPFRAKKD
jgi:hypothetical protein